MTTYYSVRVLFLYSRVGPRLISELGNEYLLQVCYNLTQANSEIGHPVVAYDLPIY